MDAIAPKTILSPEALAITPDEHEALIWFRGELASGSIRHDRQKDGIVLQRGFNMNQALCEEFHDDMGCCTTGCIGGWMYMRILSQTKTPPGKPGPKGEVMSAWKWCSIGSSRALYPLFHPLTGRDGGDLLDHRGDRFEFPYEHIDESASIAAIDNFLATGWPDWESVLEVNHA